MNIKQTGTMLSDRGRDGRIESSSGGFTVDFNDRDANREVTPEHLFAGAYAACFHSAIRSAAKRAGLEIDGSTVICSVHLGDENGHSALSVELRAAIPGVDAGKARDLLEQAHGTCPYSRAVRGNIPVKLSVD